MEGQQICNEYLTELKYAGKSLKNIKYSLNIFFKYLDANHLEYSYLKTRDAEYFQNFLITETREDGRGRFTKASVLNIVGAVSNFYEYLKRRKQVFANPFTEIERVKRSKALPRNILNEENMNKFLTHLKNFMKGETLQDRKSLYKAHVISELMYSTGARINEIAKLKVSDIDFFRGVVAVHDSKTGQKREAILGSFAEKVLKIYIDETASSRSMRELFLLNRKDIDRKLLFGARVNLKPWLNVLLNRESVRLGLGKFTTHNFRHALGFHLLRAGCDIRFIQEILGHRALHSTQIYTKVEKEDLRNVIDRYHPRKMRKSNEAF